MSAKRVFLLAAICAAAIAGAALAGRLKAKPQALAQEEGWAQYLGPFIRFRYPKGWKAAHWVAEKTHQRIWAVLTPNYLRDSKDDAGVINISCFPDQAEKRPLGEIFDLSQWPNHKLAGQPKKISVRNGQCIAYPLEESRDFGTVSKIHAYCYDGNGRFYDVWAAIGGYLQAGKPTEDVRRNARVFEDVLTSLEFL
jgi:hypothetical protein